MSRVVPPSGEVIAEEVSRRLEENGVPRGDLIRDLVREIADELAALWRLCDEDAS